MIPLNDATEITQNFCQRFGAHQCEKSLLFLLVSSESYCIYLIFHCNVGGDPFDHCTDLLHYGDHHHRQPHPPNCLWPTGSIRRWIYVKILCVETYMLWFDVGVYNVTSLHYILFQGGSMFIINSFEDPPLEPGDDLIVELQARCSGRFHLRL